MHYQDATGSRARSLEARADRGAHHASAPLGSPHEVAILEVERCVALRGELEIALPVGLRGGSARVIAIAIKLERHSRRAVEHVRSPRPPSNGELHLRLEGAPLGAAKYAAACDDLQRRVRTFQKVLKDSHKHPSSAHSRQPTEFPHYCARVGHASPQRLVDDVHSLTRIRRMPRVENRPLWHDTWDALWPSSNPGRGYLAHIQPSRSPHAYAHSDDGIGRGRGRQACVVQVQREASRHKSARAPRGDGPRADHRVIRVAGRRVHAWQDSDDVAPRNGRAQLPLGPGGTKLLACVRIRLRRDPRGKPHVGCARYSSHACHLSRSGAAVARFRAICG